MRLVFDTNVVVSALLAESSVSRRAFDRGLDGGVILLSVPVLAELIDVLGRERFRPYIDEEDVREFLAALAREAEWVEITTRISACRDPKDDKFLELAVDGHATHLITGDHDLLVLNPFRDIAIVSPASFLEAHVSEL